MRWNSYGGERYLTGDGVIRSDRDGRQIIKLQVSHRVSRAAWSRPCGRLVAVGDGHGSVYLFDTQSGEQAAPAARLAGIRLLRWSPSGEALIAGDFWGNIWRWTRKAGWRSFTSQTHSCTSVLSLDHASGMALAGFMCGSVCVWEGDFLVDRWTLKAPVTVAAWKRGSRPPRLVLGEEAGSRLIVYTVHTDTRVATDATLVVPRLFSFAESVEWSPTRVVAATLAKAIVWWPIPDRSCTSISPAGVLQVGTETQPSCVPGGAWFAPCLDPREGWMPSEERLLVKDARTQALTRVFLPLSDTLTLRRRLLARGLSACRPSASADPLMCLADFFSVYVGLVRPLLGGLLLYAR